MSVPVSDRLLAGASTVDITPSGSVFLYGYPHVPRYSTGTNDPLECAALYLRRGSGHALFLANDVICIPRAIVAAARRRIEEAVGVPAQSILISATHTHSGPVITNYVSNSADSIVPKADPGYHQLLTDKLVEAGCAAVRSAEPAELRVAVGRAEGVGTNRHDPAGPADPALPILAPRSLATGQTIGCLVVYAMHPTVLHEDSKLISGDFPAFARQFLRRGPLPAKCPVIYHNGASGNQSPRHVTKANTFAEAERLGHRLGECIASALSQAQVVAAPEIGARQQFITLEPRRFPPVPDAESSLRAIHARYEGLKAAHAPRAEVRTAECDVFGAEETLTLSKAAADGRLAAAVAASNPAEVQILSIGPWRFVGWPGEFFVEYALDLRKRLPDSYVITLANGELQGYIVTAEAAARKVYESANAVFAPENGPRFVEATLKLAGA